MEYETINKEYKNDTVELVTKGFLKHSDIDINTGGLVEVYIYNGKKYIVTIEEVEQWKIKQYPNRNK